MFPLHKLQKQFFLCLLIVTTLTESHTTRTGVAFCLSLISLHTVDSTCHSSPWKLVGISACKMLSYVKFLQCLWLGLDFCFMTRGFLGIIYHSTELFVPTTATSILPPLKRNLPCRRLLKQCRRISTSIESSPKKFVVKARTFTKWFSWCKRFDKLFAGKLRRLSAVIKIISKTFARERGAATSTGLHWIKFFRVIKSSSRLDGGFYNVWSLSPYQERERRQSLPYLLNQHQSSEKNGVMRKVR